MPDLTRADVERWQQGRTLLTRATAKWTPEQWAKNEAREKRCVFKYFSESDSGRARVLLFECRTPEEAAQFVEEHNRLCDSWLTLESKVREQDREIQSLRGSEEHEREMRVQAVKERQTLKKRALVLEDGLKDVNALNLEILRRLGRVTQEPEGSRMIHSEEMKALMDVARVRACAHLVREKFQKEKDDKQGIS